MIRHPFRTPFIGVALAVALAACSERKTQDPPASVAPSTAPAPAPAAPEASITPAGSQVIGGDGSPVLLSALTAADLAANALPGELGCAFQAGGPDPLLVAKGFVGSKDPARGLVKVTDYVEPIAAARGFDGMVKGAKFSGQGKTVVIAITGPAAGGGESPPYPATLTYHRADGAKHVVKGTWTCGP
ncbi:hypothetical protein B7G68_04920 [Caulobacter segnis]|uniref:Lipoprotein n=2 Tax=Caulobacter segnis TaxID=88688 RepID=D5VF47_CAUST|nr:hypothetical protein [Caulobacter segnis]ADG09465.1 hypothetical protein Cseg_0960 [Caulobacter segnis ATCC 21756]AVQ01260.1 hypothetical protein B7G68_04920 [Caulobacter segnis]